MKNHMKSSCFSSDPAHFDPMGPKHPLLPLPAKQGSASRNLPKAASQGEPSTPGPCEEIPATKEALPTSLFAPPTQQSGHASPSSKDRSQTEPMGCLNAEEWQQPDKALPPPVCQTPYFGHSDTGADTDQLPAAEDRGQEGGHSTWPWSQPGIPPCP